MSVLAILRRIRVSAVALTLTAGALSANAPAASAAVGTLRVQSGGYGHGVGMSQYGADGYALHGAGYPLILAHYYRGTALGTTDPDQTIRVLLGDTGEPTFSGATHAGADTLKPTVSYRVRPNADGTITLIGGPRRLKPLAAPLRVTGPGPLQLAGKGTYAGALVFTPADGANVQTVEDVGLDQYVAGVVPSEVPASWPAAALEAQAVAARTYALTADAGGTDFDVYDDTRSQAYGGVGVQSTATDQAVTDTSGQIVTYRGAPAITYFFSSSGGHTESVQNVWPGDSPEPWLVGVPDPYDGAGGSDPYHRIVHTMNLATASAKLHGLFSGTLLGVRVLSHGVSPRVLTAEVIGSRGSSQTTGAILQQRLGLLTDWEVFTTVTAASAGTPGGSGAPAKAAAAAAARRAHASTAGAAAQAMTALVPLVDSMLIHANPGLRGTVIPAPAGARILVQLRERRGWTTVGRPRIGANGGFDAALPGRGVYRVVYFGVTSPSVTVS